MIGKAPSALLLLLSIFVGSCITSHTPADSAFTDALVLVEERNYAQAAERLETLLKALPGKLPPEQQGMRHVLAYCYEKQKKWAEAVEHYQQAVLPTYDLADYAIYRLATSYGQMEDYPNAVIWYQRLIDAYPQSFHLAKAKPLAGHLQ